MKTKMGVWSFKHYLENKGNIENIIFYSEDQNDYRRSQTCMLFINFTSIACVSPFGCNNLGAIGLIDGKSRVVFNFVEEVIVDTDRSVLGDVVTVICSRSDNTKRPKKKYTLVIQYAI